MTSTKTVQVTKSHEVQISGGQTNGMIRSNAITDQADNICASVMIAKPHSSSAVHHHGPQNTIVYAAAGHGAIISQGGAKRQDLSPGDFALIPAFEEHQEVNESDQDVKWIITRSGRTPAVVNLDAWGIC